MKSFSNLTILTGNTAVSALMTPRCLRVVRAMCFISVINAMPAAASAEDEETEKSLSDLVRRHNLEYRRFPIATDGSFDAGLIDSFRDLMNDVPNPAVVFSRTGRSAVSLWALANAEMLTCEQLAEKALRAGHDISALLDAGAKQNPIAA